MSRRRRRIVGAQAAAVALLVLLVYVTLLQPQGPSTLHRIEAPDGAPTTRVDSDHRRGQNPGLNPGGGSSPGQGGQSALSGSSGSGSAGNQAGPGVTALVINTTPSDDQYTDSVSTLLRKLGPSEAVGR